MIIKIDIIIIIKSIFVFYKSLERLFSDIKGSCFCKYF